MKKQEENEAPTEITGDIHVGSLWTPWNDLQKDGEEKKVPQKSVETDKTPVRL